MALSSTLGVYDITQASLKCNFADPIRFTAISCFWSNPLPVADTCLISLSYYTIYIEFTPSFSIHAFIVRLDVATRDAESTPGRARYIVPQPESIMRCKAVCVLLTSVCVLLTSFCVLLTSVCGLLTSYVDNGRCRMEEAQSLIQRHALAIYINIFILTWCSLSLSSTAPRAPGDNSARRIEDMDLEL